MSFSLEAMSGRAVIRITLNGILSLRDVADLARAQGDLVAKLGFQPGEFDALIVVSESPIQQREVSDALTALSNHPDFRPARLAFVDSNAPVRMQLRRVNANKAAQFFTTGEEALKWLAAPAASEAGIPRGP